MHVIRGVGSGRVQFGNRTPHTRRTGEPMRQAVPKPYPRGVPEQVKLKGRAERARVKILKKRVKH